MSIVLFPRTRSCGVGRCPLSEQQFVLPRGEPEAPARLCHAYPGRDGELGVAGQENFGRRISRNGKVPDEGAALLAPPAGGQAVRRMHAGLGVPEVGLGR